MFYLRLVLVLLWLLVSSAIGLILCIPRWGDLNIDRDFAKILSSLGLKLLSLKVKLEGKEHLHLGEPCIYVANHQSGIDILTFGSVFPDKTVVIGKTELQWIPIFGLYFIAAGNIAIHRQKRMKAVAGLDQAVQAIKKKGASIWIFPEGTRNRSDDLMLPFKKGAFYMAVQAQIPIVPVVCEILGERVSFKKRLIRGGEVTIRAMPPIMTRGLTEKDIPELMVRAREQMVEALRSLPIHLP